MTDSRTAGERILVVEDEPEFAALIALWLERHEWRPIVVSDGLEALRAFEAEQPDLVVLDLGLPTMDGLEIIERIRATSTVPIIVVTARGGEADRVRGLRMGADDYVTKPVSFPELVARIGAAFRRAHTWNQVAERPELRHPGLVIDGRSHRVVVEGQTVRLTPTEYRLLRYLAERPDALLSHGELQAAIWGPGYREDHHLLRVTMRNLRAKLAAAAPARRFITTSYGLGYRFAALPEGAEAGA